MSVLSERLKTLREHKGVTQKEIADYLGISRGAYTMYETDRSEPKPERLERLAKYFSVSVEYLTGDDLDKTDIIIQKLTELTKGEKIKWDFFDEKDNMFLPLNAMIKSILESFNITESDYDIENSFKYHNSDKIYIFLNLNEKTGSYILIIAKYSNADVLGLERTISIITKVDSSEKQLFSLFESIKNATMSVEMKKQEQNLDEIIDDLLELETPPQ